MTVKQKRRQRRDLAILEGRRRGLSLRALAAIHNLSDSRIGEILDDLADALPVQNSGRAKIVPSARGSWN